MIDFNFLEKIKDLTSHKVGTMKIIYSNDIILIDINIEEYVEFFDKTL